ncbi:MAG: PepSY-like domain-containing protein [Calothrix sp. FI2-JRJ7]|jgi:hypothetical protein|nr:PepSY-like domain-containing protein [Calothrix sp. FI2-JRJ7]
MLTLRFIDRYICLLINLKLSISTLVQDVRYSSNGQWLETEYELASDNGFSSVVLDKVRAQYPSGTIKKREIEITPQGIFYEVEVADNGNEVELYFDGRGNEAPNSHEDA